MMDDRVLSAAQLAVFMCANALYVVIVLPAYMHINTGPCLRSETYSYAGGHFIRFATLHVVASRCVPDITFYVFISV